jgi:hypothetical protein
MDSPRSWVAETVSRLRPTLEFLFKSHGVSPEGARVILQEACMILVARRKTIESPDAWLLDAVRVRCERWSEEETSEDPPK